MRGGLSVAAGILAVCAAVLLFVPRIPQPPGYHGSTDPRACLGVPNCADVVSNVPFALVGAWGLGLVLARRRRSPPWDPAPYAVLFGGVFLTAFGSTYYHLAPDNARLVWDRLPMAIGFAGLLAAIAGERTGQRAARLWLWALVVAGIASVGWWRWTETHGAGDLRPYLLVQFGSLIAVAALLALSRGRYGGRAYVWTGLALYAAAKALEVADREVFAAVGVSGHTLKHVAAAAGVGMLALMLRARVSPAPGSS